MSGGLEVGAFRVELGARTRQMPVESSVDAQATRISTWIGSLAGCGRHEIFLACGDVELGANIVDAPFAAAFHAAIGARAGIEARVAEFLARAPADQPAVV